MPPPPSRPARRVVLLGASNLTIGFRTILGFVRAGFDGPLDVFAALGHGRSYGTGSRIPGRSLPGIVNCRLWDDLATSPPPTEGTQVLLTDVGNDVLYGKMPRQILEWIDECLARLAGDRTEIVVTRLPMERAARLTPWHFQVVSSVFFPFANMRWSTVKQRGEELDAGLAELAGRHAAAVVTPPAEWYGFDPIHIRPKHRQTAWRTILDLWPSLSTAETGPPPRVLNRLWWLSLRPAERRLLAIPQHRRQPAYEKHGIRLHLY